MLLYFGIEMPEIEKSNRGKPYFKNSSIYFNYSHSKNFIACALSLNEVGIDIEEIDRIISDDIAIKYLDNENDNIKRIETWVKKEAYSKLKGLGLQIKLQDINLSNLKEKSITISNTSYICSIYSDYKDPVFENISKGD